VSISCSEQEAKLVTGSGRQERLSSVNYILEVKERKLWAGEKICIPAGSAKLVKVHVEENW